MAKILIIITALIGVIVIVFNSWFNNIPYHSVVNCATTYSTCFMIWLITLYRKASESCSEKKHDKNNKNEKQPT